MYHLQSSSKRCAFPKNVLSPKNAIMMYIEHCFPLKQRCCLRSSKNSCDNLPSHKLQLVLRDQAGHLSHGDSGTTV